MAKYPKQSSLEADPPSPLAQDLVASLLGRQATPRQPHRISLKMADPFGVETPPEKMTKKELEKSSPLLKSVLNVLNGPGNSIERLAFETDPAQTNLYFGLFRMKLRLLPDHILKRIAIQDDLVAAIVNTRANQVSVFGRPQPDRFSTGFKIEVEQDYMEKLSAEEKKAVQARVDTAVRLLTTCGHTTGWADEDQLTLGQFLYMSARNAVTVGRMATEIIYVESDSGEEEFHAFRPIDAGTIYRAAPHHEPAQQVRDSALRALKQLKNKDLAPERFKKDEYKWVQVIEGRPVQAFTAEECVVHNFYPVTDVELGGYPLTPIDTAIAAVTTHINITNHNKLYFQSGRAARGMIVIKSDDIDSGITDVIRQQFQASINSVGNAWRMPVFGIGAQDEVSWQPIDNSSRDMEFSYLSDTNARVILSAFQMSPEELPGYAHLSRGTNNQALSESNNEYKLEAARDVGIRPLISQFQNFLNARIFPLIDAELAKVAVIKLVGLDADTAEKESIRIQQDMGLHMTFDEVLERVEKKPLGKKWGGQYPMNPQIQAILDAHCTVGEIEEHFFGRPNASKDPMLQYRRDPLWFNWVELQAQMQQAQQPQGAPPDGSQPSPDGANPGQGQPQQGQPQAAQGQPSPDGEDLSRSLDQLVGMLSKSEQQLPQSRRRLLAQQRKLVAHVLDEWEQDSKSVLAEAVAVAEKMTPRRK